MAEGTGGAKRSKRPPPDEWSKAEIKRLQECIVTFGDAYFADVRPQVSMLSSIPSHEINSRAGKYLLACAMHVQRMQHKSLTSIWMAMALHTWSSQQCCCIAGARMLCMQQNLFQSRLRIVQIAVENKRLLICDLLPPFVRLG